MPSRGAAATDDPQRAPLLASDHLDAVQEDTFDPEDPEAGYHHVTNTSTRRQSSATADLPPPGGGRHHSAPPAAKWRDVALSAVALKRMVGAPARAPGLLPGMDVKRDGSAYAQLYAHVKAHATISLADYSRDKVDIVEGASNESLGALLNRPRPSWAKVRWINIQGLSWDLVAQLAHKFDLHPLAVEDVMHHPQRIKADFYEQHLFISFSRFFIQSPSTIARQRRLSGAADDTATSAAGAAAATPSQPPQHPSRSPSLLSAAPTSSRASWAAQPLRGGPHHSAAGSARGSATDTPADCDGPPLTFSGASSGGYGDSGRPAVNAATFIPRGSLREDYQYRRDEGAAGAVRPMELTVEQLSLFLMRDGTLVSLFHGDAEDVSRPILERLRGLKTLLTDSEDASFLAEVLLDQIVDQMLPMVALFARRISSLEAKVLTETRPRAEYTKELHLLSNDCAVLRRALIPAQQLIHKLQATAAAAADTDSGGTGSAGGSRHGGVGEAGGNGGAEEGLPSVAARCLLSPLTQLYLGDVLDHLDTVIDDMESLALQAKELIELIFNQISHQSNASMQMLSIVNTVFLPLTFLAGVFGTNFTAISAYQWDEGFYFFWGLCAAVTATFVVLLRRWGMFTS